MVRGQRLGLLPTGCAAFLAIVGLKGILVYTDRHLSAWLGARVTTDLHQRRYNQIRALTLAVAGQWHPDAVLPPDR